MNEEAAQHIENCRYGEALEVLDFAMETLHSVAEHEEDEDQFEQPAASTCEMYEQSATNPCSDAVKSSRTPISPQMTEDFDGDFVYTTPMRYVDSEETELDAISMGVILTFNMALTHHISAMMSKKKGNMAFKCALKMYQLSFCLLLKGEAQLSVTQVLALTNNCGQIYKHLKREAKARTFFTHMLTTLMTMIEGGDADDVDNLDGFMWNASRFILEDPALAAAA
eukprot:CAMPEP_0117019916 /NCGR_PEP_ID=MMETSP0472-20121206/15206_1 /TAXON_ID=693140 ORGANISM="Tiarina fusus, Strain LIS" /NCGR_SAMPLE_ID=MMETSP0472 /ASSEMBLY_ACC=CAM_ASM_000603 /LENGTH=224 /DNA_ID=CAMNT_0004724983 /DNA_START=65 /DNA_END=739 /DNA_ORIENTATION=-